MPLVPPRVRKSLLPSSLALALFFTVACNGADSSPAPVEIAVRDSAGVRLVDVPVEAWSDLPRWTLSELPELTIGETEGADAYLLSGAFRATRLSDGRIAVLNGRTQQVRVFDREGTHLVSMGASGQGPGEFSWPHWLGRLADDSLIVTDAGGRPKFVVFAADGTHGRTWSPVGDADARQPEVLGMVANGAFVAKAGFDRVFGRGERRDSVPVMLLAPDGTVADTIGVLPGEERYFVAVPEFATVQPVGFARNMHVAAGGDRIAMGASDSYEISIHDSEGRLITRIRSARTPVPVTAGQLAEWRTSMETRHPPFMETAEWAKLMAPVPARETHPSFSQLAIDTRGNVWVAEPRTSTADASVEWTVFASTGEPLALVTAPPGFQLLEAGDNYLLGRAVDDDGVERIQQYELRRGG